MTTTEPTCAHCDKPATKKWLAAESRAEGQCPRCGSYRLDGKPPVLHRPGCKHADDWKTDPLRVLRESTDG